MKQYSLLDCGALTSHTYIHTYIKYIQTYIHTYIHTFGQGVGKQVQTIGVELVKMEYKHMHTYI